MFCVTHRFMNQRPARRLGRRLPTLPAACLLAVAALAGRAHAQGGVTFDFSASGTQSAGWDFPNGTLPTAPGAVKTYTGTAMATANADGVNGPSSGLIVSGTKLTYTSAGTAFGLPWGAFAPGPPIAASDASTGPRGSITFGNIILTGSHTGVGDNPNRATATATASLHVGSLSNAYAHFGATAADPYPFSWYGGGPIPGGTSVHFGLSLPSSGNQSPTAPGSGLTWSATYTGLFAPINTSDAAQFYASNPQPLYSLSFGVDGSGMFAHFTPGSLPGISFSHTPAQIESAVAAALSSGWSGDLSALSGSIDVSGLSAASIGYTATVAATAVPAPGSMALLLIGGLAAARRRR